MKYLKSYDKVTYYSGLNKKTFDPNKIYVYHKINRFRSIDIIGKLRLATVNDIIHYQETYKLGCMLIGFNSKLRIFLTGIEKLKIIKRHIVGPEWQYVKEATNEQIKIYEEALVEYEAQKYNI